MGEVLLARDLRLGTQVAIKFLTVTALLAGAGVLAFGLAKADLKGQYRRTTNWVKGVGRDDEWDRFFDEENGCTANGA